MKTADSAHRAILLQETTLGELEMGDLFLPCNVGTSAEIMLAWSRCGAMVVSLVTGAPHAKDVDPRIPVYKVTVAKVNKRKARTDG